MRLIRKVAAHKRLADGPLKLAMDCVRRKLEHWEYLEPSWKELVAYSATEVQIHVKWQSAVEVTVLLDRRLLGAVVGQEVLQQ